MFFDNIPVFYLESKEVLDDGTMKMSKKQQKVVHKQKLHKMLMKFVKNIYIFSQRSFEKHTNCLKNQNIRMKKIENLF